MSRLSETLTARADELGISQTELADRTGALQQSISALFSGDVASPRKWREIARELQIPESDMREMMIEAGKESGRPTRIPKEEPYTPNGRVDPSPLPAPSRPGKLLPVLGEVIGGDDGRFVFNGTVIDYVACPPSLEGVPGAYAVYIAGESMYPRYKSGETAWVHPHKPARRGDDVIVQIHPGEEGMPPEGYVKELVGWTGSKLTLQQFNPPTQLVFDRNEVVSIHPIVLSGKY